MKEKIASEFYQLVEWLKTKDTGELLPELLDRELGDILDYVEGDFGEEDRILETYITLRIEEMMFKYGDMEVCGFAPDQEKLRSIIEGK